MRKIPVRISTDTSKRKTMGIFAGIFRKKTEKFQSISQKKSSSNSNRNSIDFLGTFAYFTSDLYWNVH